jgi:hypothetical protein
MKKTLIVIIGFLLAVNIVTATLQGAVFGFAHDMSMSYLSAQNPALGKTINFVLCPSCAATNEVMGYVGKLDKQLAEALSLGMNPEGALKAKIKEEVFLHLEPEERQLIKNIEQYQPYLEKVFKENPQAPKEEARGKIEIDAQGNTIIKDGSGEVFASIPEGFEALHTEEGLVFTNKEAKDGAVLQVKNYRIQTKTNGKIIFAENEEGSLLRLEGTGSVAAGFTNLNYIQDATIEMDHNNQVSHARFTATRAETYQFAYGLQTFTFTATEGSEIDFDPKKNSEPSTNHSSKSLKLVKWGTSRILNDNHL